MSECEHNYIGLNLDKYFLNISAPAIIIQVIFNDSDLVDG